MIRFASPRLPAYVAAAAVGLIGALALGRPELVAVAAPFLLVLAFGLALARTPVVETGFELAEDRTIEGVTVEAAVRVAAGPGGERVEVFLPLPDGLASEAAGPLAAELGPGERRTLPVPIRAERWGAYPLGDVHLRARDRLGLFSWELVLPPAATLKVFPSEERLRALLSPRDTQVFSGSEVARPKGDGIEFADIRPFVPGDRPRRVNWRASARRGELWVNELHTERNTDVVLLLDTFSEARRAGASTLDQAVRAAASIAAGYLGRKDRVGVVGFGGLLRWLAPSLGTAQLYRIVDALLDTEVVTSYAWKDITVVPPRTLPPQALVVALSPLLDDRTAGAFLDLAARGYDLAVIEVSPEPFVRHGPSELDALAYRLWRLDRAARRSRYERLGIPVVQWREGEALEGAIGEVRAFRRHALRARA